MSNTLHSFLGQRPFVKLVASLSVLSPTVLFWCKKENGRANAPQIPSKRHQTTKRSLVPPPSYVAFRKHRHHVEDSANCSVSFLDPVLSSAQPSHPT